MSNTITSLSNPLIKQVRKLRQRKERAESGLFLVEGIHHVGAVIEAGWPVQIVLYDPERLVSDFGRDLVNRLEQRQIRIQALSTKVMESIAEKDHPSGLLAVVAQRRLSLADLVPHQIRYAVALVAPQDPGNVGAILRTMDAVGASALFLLNGGVDPYHPSLVRASMGALFWIPTVSASFEEFVAWARRHQLSLIGASPHAPLSYRAYRPPKRWGLLFGSEQKGLSPDQVEACDQTISLPMRGRLDSLNLAVAVGVLLYTWLG